MRGEREEGSADASPCSCSQTPTLFLLEYVHHVSADLAPWFRTRERSASPPPRITESKTVIT